MPDARLQVYRGARAASVLRKSGRVDWHAAATTQPGEVAFFYEAAPVSGIVAVGRATGDPDLSRKWGRLIAYDRVMLPEPLTLAELRADPVAGRWPVWRMLSRTHVRIPPVTAAAVARLAAARSAAAAKIVAPLLTESG